jgi:hypothetical protein
MRKLPYLPHTLSFFFHSFFLHNEDKDCCPAPASPHTQFLSTPQIVIQETHSTDHQSQNGTEAWEVRARAIRQSAQP